MPVMLADTAGQQNTQDPAGSAPDGDSRDRCRKRTERRQHRGQRDRGPQKEKASSDRTFQRTYRFIGHKGTTRHMRVIIKVFGTPISPSQLFRNYDLFAQHADVLLGKTRQPQVINGLLQVGKTAEHPDRFGNVNNDDLFLGAAFGHWLHTCDEPIQFNADLTATNCVSSIPAGQERLYRVANDGPAHGAQLIDWSCPERGVLLPQSK